MAWVLGVMTFPGFVLLLIPHADLLGHGLITLPALLGFAIGIAIKRGPSPTILIPCGSILFIGGAIALGYGVIVLPVGTLLYAAGLAKAAKRRFWPWRKPQPWRPST
jgi:hypothetical protein